MHDEGHLPGAGADTARLKLCRGRAGDVMARVFERFLTALDESIKAQAETGEFEAAQQALLEELRLLQLNRDQLGSQLQARFNTSYDDTVSALSGCASLTSSTDEGFAGLTLIDDHELEEMLVIDRQAARILETHDREIRALVRRFECLLATRPLGRSGLPIAPERFFQTFQRVFDGFELGLEARLHAHGLLGGILGEELADFYRDINTELAGQGILPDLIVDPDSQPSSSRPRPQASAADAVVTTDVPQDAFLSDTVSTVDEHQPAPQRTAMPVAPASLQDQMFQAMQYLLNAHFSREDDEVESTGVDGQASSAARLPVTPMLIDTLSTLQHDETLVTRSGELIRGGLRQHVIGRYACDSRAGDNINRIDDETIDVISMIFDYILDDPSLPDFIKALIGRLQIPVLKVAILDREFFSRKSHPARQLLNELSRAGLGWREEQEATRDRLYQKMEAIVRRILDEFEGDIAIFEELLTEFRSFLDEENRGFGEAQVRLLEVARAHEHQERVTVEVAKEIARRLVDKPLPDDIREFVSINWREHVTALVLAEEDPEAGIPADALTFIDDLAWSLQPKRDGAERRRLIAMLPGLLDTLRRAMDGLGRDGDQTEAVIASLERHHRDCMRPPPRVAEPAPVTRADRVADEGSDVDRVLDEINSDLDSLSSIDWDSMMSFDDVIEDRGPEQQQTFERMIAEMGLELDRDNGPRIEDEFTEQVRTLELGAWVELTDDQGLAQRARLAWKGDDYSSFSFMNRQYKVVAERPLYELADDFRHGRAAVIEHAAPFDRAINGVIAGITRLAGAAGR